MTTFSEIYADRDDEVRRILADVRCPSVERLKKLLEGAQAGAFALSELAELLEIGATAEAGGQFDLLRSFVLANWRKPQGNRVRYVAPIYVSSFCIDTCAYCNFSASRKGVQRRRLTLDELRDEIDTVREQDIRVIELVFASDPGFTAELLVRYVAETVKALDNEKGSGVLLCSEYLSLDAHRALRDAGLAGIVQWDETLDRLAYHRWHAASPHKREFRARMDNHDRALSAGLEVATGALLGLADFRYDVLMQVAKARHFVAEHGRGPFVFGTARLRPIAGRELHLRTCLTDRAYETALMVYRVAVPGAGRWLQTRETFEMNLRNVLDGDVFTYRCGDVRPGGYHGNGPLATAGSGGQFGVNELERGFVERELAVRSFRIDYGWMTTGSEAIASTSSSSFSPSVQGPCPDAMLM